MWFAMEKWNQTAFFALLNIEMQGREHTPRARTRTLEI